MMKNVSDQRSIWHIGHGKNLNNLSAQKMNNERKNVHVNMEKVSSIDRSRSNRKSRLLRFFIPIGTICAVLTTILVLLLVLLLYKSTTSSNNSNENSISTTQNSSNVSSNSTTSVPTTLSSTTVNLTSNLSTSTSNYSTTASSSTTTSFNTCYLQWNSTKLIVAGYSNGTSASTSIGLDHPRCIFIDKNDDLYIADNFNNRIQRWSPNATIGVTVAGDPNGTSGWTGGKIYYPTSVHLDSSLNMYVLDNGNYRVLQYAPGSSVGTAIAGTTGITGNASYSWGQAWTMAVDTSNNEVYLADLWYNRILVWPFFANDSSSIIPISDVVGVTIDTIGNVYATAHNLNTVVRFPAGSQTGSVIVSSGLTLPWALRFDKYGNLYVANTGSGTITMFCANFTANTTGAVVASGLDQPVDVAFDSNMNMYVAEYGKHRIVKFTKLP